MSAQVANILEQANTVLVNELRNEFAAQGHHLTGALEDSIHGVVSEYSDYWIESEGNRLQGYALFYGNILDKGVSPERVPFQEGSGAIHSKFIDALIGYFEARGHSAKDAKSYAFATAKVMKQKGMPTPGSMSYSSTGQRTDFINNMNNKMTTTIDPIILNGINELVHIEFNKTKSETI